MVEYRPDDEIRIPVAVLHALSEAADRDGEAVAAAVRDAGRAAGDDIARRIARAVALPELDAVDFWSAVNAETGARGLGTFEWERGIGGHAEILVHGSPDGPDPDRPLTIDFEAPFTEGLIEGLLGATAEETVAAVRAPFDGGTGIRFVIGSPVLLRHIRLRLQSGATLDQALEGI
ncbi:MAG: hypothetical protein Q8W45_01570 [Candidatus Palauibacterales bacterium]|nr:hypothetical protein [Candidatus Palauibacterales bacterium]MDP2481944.1 hypothetical protein [Candidatus Palauibacterales bacterium]